LLEDGRADEGCRLPAFVVKNSRERMSGRLQNETAGAADVVHGRILSGENAGVRWRRQGCLGDSVLEQNATLGEMIKRGSLDVLIAVAMDMVGTERVDRNDHHVQCVRLGLSSRLVVAGRAGGRGEEND